MRKSLRRWVLRLARSTGNGPTPELGCFAISASRNKHKKVCIIWRTWSAFVALVVEDQMSTRVSREKAVFVEALEIADREQRSQFLYQACGTDPALREQVENISTLSQSAVDFYKDASPA